MRFLSVFSPRTGLLIGDDFQFDDDLQIFVKFVFDDSFEELCDIVQISIHDALERAKSTFVGIDFLWILKSVFFLSQVYACGR